MKPKDSAKRKSCSTAPSPSHALPLKDRKLYLDLKGYRALAVLENDLLVLGAVIEKCFSKDVSILITNKGTPKDYERSRCDGEVRSPTSPATHSPFSVPADSPQPHSPGAWEPPIKPLTRGQKLAHVARGKRCEGSTDIVECAKKWKVKVVHLDVAQKWVKKEILKLPESVRSRKKVGVAVKKQTKVHRFKASFVKFEASNRHYRPLFSELETFPQILWDTSPGHCPFEYYRGRRKMQADDERAEVEERDPRRQEGESERRESQELPDTPNASRNRNGTGTGSDDVYTKLMTAGEMKRHVAERQRKENKKGYCEMCNLKYDDIDKHVKCDTHKKFVRDQKNYQKLDGMIHHGHDMDTFLQEALARSKSSRAQQLSVDDSDEEIMLMSAGSSPRMHKKTSVSKRLDYTRLHQKDGQRDTLADRNKAVALRVAKEFNSERESDTLVVVQETKGQHAGKGLKSPKKAGRLEKTPKKSVGLTPKSPKITPKKTKTPKKYTPIKMRTPQKSRTPDKTRTPKKRGTPIKKRTPQKHCTPVKMRTPQKSHKVTPSKGITPKLTPKKSQSSKQVGSAALEERSLRNSPRLARLQCPNQEESGEVPRMAGSAARRKLTTTPVKKECPVAPHPDNAGNFPQSTGSMTRRSLATTRAEEEPLVTSPVLKSPIKKLLTEAPNKEVVETPVAPSSFKGQLASPVRVTRNSRCANNELDMKPETSGQKYVEESGRVLSEERIAQKVHEFNEKIVRHRLSSEGIASDGLDSADGPCVNSRAAGNNEQLNEDSDRNSSVECPDSHRRSKRERARGMNRAKHDQDSVESSQKHKEFDVLHKKHLPTQAPSLSTVKTEKVKEEVPSPSPCPLHSNLRSSQRIEDSGGAAPTIEMKACGRRDGHLEEIDSMPEKSSNKDQGAPTATGKDRRMKKGDVKITTPVRSLRSRLPDIPSQETSVHTPVSLTPETDRTPPSSHSQPAGEKSQASGSVYHDTSSANDTPPAGLDTPCSTRPSTSNNTSLQEPDVFSSPDIDPSLMSILLADVESTMGRRKTRAIANMDENEARARYLQEIKARQAIMYHAATSSANNSPVQSNGLSSPVLQRPLTSQPNHSSSQDGLRKSKNKTSMAHKNDDIEHHNSKQHQAKPSKKTSHRTDAAKSSATTSGKEVVTRSCVKSPEDLAPSDIERVMRKIQTRKTSPGAQGSNIYQEKIGNNTSRFWFYVPVSPGPDDDGSRSSSGSEHSEDGSEESTSAAESVVQKNLRNKSVSGKQTAKKPASQSSNFWHYVPEQSDESCLRSETEASHIDTDTGRSLRKRSMPTATSTQRGLHKPQAGNNVKSKDKVKEYHADETSDCVEESDGWRRQRPQRKRSRPSYGTCLRKELYRRQCSGNIDYREDSDDCEDDADTPKDSNSVSFKSDDTNGKTKQTRRNSRFWSYEEVSDVNVLAEEVVLATRTRSSVSSLSDSRKSMDPYLEAMVESGEDYMDAEAERGDADDEDHDAIPKQLSRKRDLRTRADRSATSPRKIRQANRVTNSGSANFDCDESESYSETEVDDGEQSKVDPPSSKRRRNEGTDEVKTNEIKGLKTERSPNLHTHPSEKNKGSRRTKFWYYAPVTNAEAQESHTESDTGVRRTRNGRVIGERPGSDEGILDVQDDDKNEHVNTEELIENNNQTRSNNTSNRKRRSRSQRWIYVPITETPEKYEPGCNDMSVRKTRTGCIFSEALTDEDVGNVDSSARGSDDGGACSMQGKNSLLKKRTRKQFWHFEPVTDEKGYEDSDDTVTYVRKTRAGRMLSEDNTGAHEEVRDSDEAVNCDDQQNTSLQDKRTRNHCRPYWRYEVVSEREDKEVEVMDVSTRKTRTGRIFSETGEVLTSNGKQDVTHSDTQGKMNHENIIKSKGKRHSKFWYYAPVTNEDQEEASAILEDEVLKTQTGSILNNPGTRHEDTKQQERVTDSKSSGQTDEVEEVVTPNLGKSRRRKKQFWHYVPVSPVEHEDSGQESEVSFKASGSGWLRSEEHGGGVKQQHKRRPHQFWHYVPLDTLDSGQESDITITDNRCTRSGRLIQTDNEEGENGKEQNSHIQNSQEQDDVNPQTHNIRRKSNPKFWYYETVSVDSKDSNNEDSETYSEVRKTRAGCVIGDLSAQENTRTEKDGRTEIVENNITQKTKHTLGLSEEELRKRERNRNEKEKSMAKFYTYTNRKPNNIFEEVIIEGPRRTRNPNVNSTSHCVNEQNQGEEHVQLKEEHDLKEGQNLHKNSHKREKHKKKSKSKQRFWFYVVETNDVEPQLKPEEVLDRASRRRASAAGVGADSTPLQPQEDDSSKSQKSKSRKLKDKDHQSKENKEPVRGKNKSDAKESRKRRRVRLKESWALASNRSIKELLNSGEEDADFEGFEPETVNDSVLSDVSYHEVNEVEVSDNSVWEYEDEENETAHDERHMKAALAAIPDFGQFMRSPIRDDGASSDWDDNLEEFVAGQVQQKKDTDIDTEIIKSFARITPRKRTTPRKHVTPRKRVTPGKHVTPHRLLALMSPKNRSRMEKTPGEYSAVMESSGLFELVGSEVEELWAGPVPMDKSKYAKEGKHYKPSTPQLGVLTGTDNTPKSYLRAPVTPSTANLVAGAKHDAYQAIAHSTPIAASKSSTTVLKDNTPRSTNTSSRLQDHRPVPTGVSSNPAQNGAERVASSELKKTVETLQLTSPPPPTRAVPIPGASPITTSPSASEGPKKRLLKNMSNVKSHFSMSHLPSHQPNRPKTWVKRANSQMGSPKSGIREVCLSPLGAWPSVGHSGKNSPSGSKGENVTPSRGMKHVQSRELKSTSPRKSSVLPSWMISGISRRSPRKLSIDGDKVTVPRFHSDASSDKFPMQRINAVLSPGSSGKRKLSQDNAPRKKLCLSHSPKSRLSSPAGKPSKSSDSIHSGAKKLNQEQNISSGKMSKKLAEQTYEFGSELDHENDPYEYS